MTITFEEKVRKLSLIQYELINLMKNSDQHCNVSIAWRNLQYEAKSLLGSNKVILRRLNGHLNCNTLNGFLGPSGAGKTTLLNCLNGTLRSGISSDSEIYINRRQQQTPVIRFIQQHVHETIIGKMTIRQVLYYAFRFKNERRHLSKMDKHISDILAELLLDEDILNTKFENCSGGEQRRIAIAQELMSLDKPTFLFVDEPTTGLDSNAAHLMMLCLRKLANSNHPITILASIHTPSSDIMALFDKVYILAKGGVCIYSDSPKYLKAKLEENIGQEVNEEEKPVIEEYLKIACYGIQNEAVQKLADSTLSEEHEKLMSKMEQLKFLPKGIENKHKPFNIADLFLQFHRMFNIVFVIEYQKLLFQLIFFAVINLLFSTLFGKNIFQINICESLNIEEMNISCSNDLDSDWHLYQYKLYHFWSFMTYCVIIMTTSAIFFLSMLKVLRNEHRNSWYGIGTFYWSFFIVRLIEISFIVVYLTFFLYFTIDHRQLDKGQMNWFRFAHFVYFSWLYILYLQSGTSLLCLIFMNNSDLVLIGNLYLLTACDLLTGFMVDFNKIENPIISMQTKLIPSKIIANGLMYSTFALEQCQSENQISFVFQDFKIDQETIYTDTIVFALNIVALNIITRLLMFYRFSFIGLRKTSIKFSNQNHAMKSIDYGDYSKNKESLTIDPNRINRIKHQDELKFEDFARHKIIVAWRSVTLFASKSIYEIRSATNVNKNEKLILRNLNGQFRFGTLNALMGTSGAGKTSLLKILNGRSKTRLSEESQFYLSKFTPIRTSYITQEVSGHLLPGLTAKQSLIYASKLKNVNDNVDHEQIAMNILKELDIVDTADTMVQKCSGGQRKRLALGLEITSVRMPNLICIDEPTSGLDSNSSELVIGCLSRLTHAHNITIIASIHQPNFEVLMMFDQLYVLAKGGVCIYSGRPCDISQHLSHVSNRINREDIFPIEELIKYSCLKHTDSIVENLVELTNKQSLNEDDQLSEETQQLLDGIPSNRNRFSLKSVFILLIRHWSYIISYLHWHTISFILVYIGFGLFNRSMVDSEIAQVSGCISLDEDFNNTCALTDDKIQERSYLILNFVFTSCSYDIYLFTVFVHIALTFNKERSYFLNERRNGWYTTGTFYMMKCLETIPIYIIVTPIYTYISNIVEPIRPGIYYHSLFLFFISTAAIQAVGYLAAISFSNFLHVVAACAAVTIFFIMDSNVVTPVSRLHYVPRFLSYFSMFRYPVEAYNLLQYGFGRCRKKEIQAVLYFLDIKNDEYYYHCIIMILFHLILYHILAITVFWLKSNSFENRRTRIERINSYHQKLLTQSLNVNIPGLDCHHDFTIKTIEI